MFYILKFFGKKRPNLYIKVKVMGDGFWKVWRAYLHVLGCYHTHPQLCEMCSSWQQELLQNPDQFRSNDMVKIACEKKVYFCPVII